MRRASPTRSFATLVIATSWPCGGGPVRGCKNQSSNDDADNAGHRLHQGISQASMSAGIDRLKQFQHAGGGAHKKHCLVKPSGKAEGQGKAEQHIGQGTRQVHLTQMRPHLDRRQSGKRDCREQDRLSFA